MVMLILLLLVLLVVACFVCVACIRDSLSVVVIILPRVFSLSLSLSLSLSRSLSHLVSSVSTQFLFDSSSISFFFIFIFCCCCCCCCCCSAVFSSSSCVIKCTFSNSFTDVRSVSGFHYQNTISFSIVINNETNVFSLILLFQFDLNLHKNILYIH